MTQEAPLYRIMRSAVSIIVFILLSAGMYAQGTDSPSADFGSLTVTDTASVPHRSLLTFERLLSSFRWNLSHRTDYVSDRWFLMVDERFRSDLIRTDRKFIKDQQEIRFLGGRQVHRKFDVRVSGSSLLLSDNQITGLNDAAISDVYAGIGLTPYDKLTLAPYIGYSTDRQARNTDSGVSYLAQVYGDEIPILDALISLHGQYSQQNIDPRTIARHFLRVHADHAPDRQTAISLQTYYTYTRREFYFAADDATERLFGVSMNIDQRYDRRFGTAGEIRYAVRENIAGTVSAAIDWRTVTRGYYYQPTTPVTSYLFSTAVDEFSLNLRLGLNYSAGNWFSGNSHITYIERSEEHGVRSVDPSIPLSITEERSDNEFMKNNIARRTTLATNGRIGITRGHRFIYGGSASILRYDTPSPRNYDDRDELRILLSMGTFHEISRYLTLRLSLDAVMTHVVYLQSQRSANNNWNRVLRLTPSATYKPSDWFQTTNAFEVLANYTVYDYEDLLTSVRSLSYRQIGWIDSTRVTFSKRMRFDLFSHYRRYERGELSWRVFSERPLHSFEEWTLIAAVRFDLAPGRIAFAGGIRYFIRNRYRYEGREREFDNQLRAIGPTCYIYWRMDNRLNLQLNGWYELQYRDSKHFTSIPNISVEIGARF